MADPPINTWTSRTTVRLHIQGEHDLDYASYDRTDTKFAGWNPHPGDPRLNRSFQH
jgi:hypothetical protein